MLRFFTLLLCLLSPTLMAEVTLEPLFQIDRSQNNNVVRYDARVRSDETLDPREPIAAYWFRPEDADEPTRPLGWIQKRFAYGFKAEFEADTVTLDMVADIGRPIVVIREPRGYRATMVIDGADCYIGSLYVASSGSGLGTKVEYIDLRGREVGTGEERFERITP